MFNVYKNGKMFYEGTPEPCNCVLGEIGTVADVTDEFRELVWSDISSDSGYIDGLGNVWTCSYVEDPDNPIATTCVLVSSTYEDNVCPDCSEPIPDTAQFGESCSNCGHVWTEVLPDED